MDEISFRLGVRVDRNAVEPAPPQPQMYAATMDESPEAR